MAKRIICDVCERPIADGENAGIRNPIFSFRNPAGVLVEVQTTARVNGNSGADLCVLCLKRAVVEA